MKKPFYSLEEIKAVGPVRSAGKNWMATCPECGKQHLSISKALGVYHCFTPGCGCDGVLRDRLSDLAAPYAGRLRITPDPARAGGGKETAAESVGMLPCDYKRLPDEALAKMYPLKRPEAPEKPKVPDNPERPEAPDKPERPEAPERPEPPRAQAAVEAYLAGQGFALATAEALRLCYARHRCYGSDDKLGRECDCLVYVNYVDGRPVNAKYRAVEGKLFSQDSPTTPCPPYNIDCINPLLVAEDQVDRLVIVEGEKDVLTLRQAGYRYVVSVANGAATDVARCFDPFAAWLEAVRDVVICGDSDLPGRTLQHHLADYFGARAYAVTLPGECKDISEVMQHYGLAAVREVVDNAAPLFRRDIVQVSDIADSVLRRLHGDYDHGYSLGYGPLTDGVLHLTDQGGLIIVTGKPNAGKTDFLNDICAHMIFKCRKRVCLCSFEVPDKAAHTCRFVQLGLGRADTSLFTSDDLRPMLDYLDAHFSHIDTDSIDPTPQNIIRLAEAAHRRAPLHALVVDPYMFLNLGTAANETLAIKRMLTLFQRWGRRNHVWVIIVAHPRKLNKLSGSNDLEKIDMYTIAGSANWANLADFIISVSRIRGDSGADTDADVPAVVMDYTKVDVLKVRDQEMCRTGSVLYTRQPCGRYDERPDVETVRAETLGRVLKKDQEVWLPL